MNNNEAQTNTAVQYIEWWVVTKIQATGGDKYLLIYIVILFIAIRIISKVVSVTKRAIREPIQETEAEYLRRISQSDKRNQELAENEDQIFSKQFPNGIKKSEYYEKKRKGEVK